MSHENNIVVFLLQDEKMSIERSRSRSHKRKDNQKKVPARIQSKSTQSILKNNNNNINPTTNESENLNTISMFVRIRPFLNDERHENLVQIRDNTEIMLQLKRNTISSKFTHVFDSQNDNKSVFHAFCEPQIEQSLVCGNTSLCNNCFFLKNWTPKMAYQRK